MFGFDEARDNYQQVDDAQPNEASFGHEALAGAASFGAMKLFEDHQRKEGKPIEHQFAKELIAGFAGAEVDRLAETKGADFVDREEAKRRARDNAQDLYQSHYQRDGGDQYDPNQYGPPQQIQDHFGDQQYGGYGNQNY